MTGMSPERYDELAKSILTISANETKYGNSDFYKYLDKIKRSKGVAQLRLDNINWKAAQDMSLMKPEQIEKIKKDSKSKGAVELLSKLLSSDEDTKNDLSTRQYALAALLYADKLENDLSRNRQDAVDQRGIDAARDSHNSEDGTLIDPLTMRVVRHYMGQKDGDIKTVGRNIRKGNFEHLYDNEVYEDSLFGRNRINFHGKTVKLPYKGFKSDEEYNKEVEELLDKEFPNQGLRHNIKDGRRYISRKTKGNTIDNTIQDNLFYGWRSRRPLVIGDAQGDSDYYKRSKDIYKLLFGEPPVQENVNNTPLFANPTTPVLNLPIDYSRPTPNVPTEFRHKK